GPMHHRRYPTPPPRLAMHRIGAKARLVPEENVCTLSLGHARQPRIALALPALNGLGISLISTLQWLLRREPQLGQQHAHCTQAQPNSKLLLNEQRDNAPRPQTKIEFVLARVTTVYPTTFLPRIEPARASTGRPRAQRTHATS